MEIHYLNVDEGDCSVIKHDSGRITMIDICCGNLSQEQQELGESLKQADFSAATEGLRGNFNQKAYPINPIDWISKLTDSRIFRFVATHPDMDHLDGLKALFTSKFKPHNFWDTENDKQMDASSDFGEYNKEDWSFYQKLHTENTLGVTRLFLKEGAKGRFYNQDADDGSGEGDRIKILSPSKKIEQVVSETGNVNDISYVLLMTTAAGRKVLFCGDSEKDAWDILLKRYEKDLENIDILIAPHHGRKTGGNDNYLSVLKPKFSILGNAKSGHMGYSAWNNRQLIHFTNNQLGSVIFNETKQGFEVYVTCKNAALKWHQQINPIMTEAELLKHDKYEAYFLDEIK